MSKVARVDLTDAEWRALKIAAVHKGQSIQDYLSAALRASPTIRKVLK
jgi:hypothetical protein